MQTELPPADEPECGSFYNIRQTPKEDDVCENCVPLLVRVGPEGIGQVAALWSRPEPDSMQLPPPLGTRVRQKFDNLGRPGSCGTVEAYCVESGFLALQILTDAEQRICLFGAEVSAV